MMHGQKTIKFWGQIIPKFLKKKSYFSRLSSGKFHGPIIGNVRDRVIIINDI
jgi:hypothetical protein